MLLYNSINLIYCSDATSRGSNLNDIFSLSRLLSKFRIIINSIKFDLKLTVLDKTSINREKPPELVFERLKIAHFKHEKDADVMEVESLYSSDSVDSKEEAAQDEEENHSSLLYSSYEQMSKLDITLFRPKRPQGAEPHLSFSVVFRGEYVVGEGGPYRQFFADLSSEIQPQSAVIRNPDDPSQNKTDNEVSILCPSPNNIGDVTDYKEYFVITPSCITTKDLALYEYLGVLMGVCIRTNVHLTLDLASVCWKPLVGEDITVHDLFEIDKGFIERCNYILECPEDQFEDTIFDSFSVDLSDGSVFELCEGGKDIQVTYQNRNEFLIKAISARIAESQMQCQAIKTGISKIIPEGLLNLMTVEELREAVCGKIKCDLELLKRNTEYGGNNSKELEQSELIKWFWEVLEEISEQDRLKFIVFCWGQERLPANDEEFKYSKTRFMIKPAVNQSYGDGALPRANTCFFNFELPSYSSKEILKEKLLLAINTDNRSMNAEQQELLEHQGRNDVYDDDY